MQLAQPIGFTWICMSRAYLDFNVFVKWNLIRDRKHTSAIGLKWLNEFAWVYFITIQYRWIKFETNISLFTTFGATANALLAWPR